MYDKATIKDMLATNKEWAIRGLLAVYEKQTANEKLTQSTKLHNGVGFTGFDAEILSSFSEQFKTKGWLSTKQVAILFKRMPKYAQQLYNIQLENRGLQLETEIVLEASEIQFALDGTFEVQGDLRLKLDDMFAQRDIENEILFWEWTSETLKVTVIND